MYVVVNLRWICMHCVDLKLTVLSFVIFCCIRMHMWTLHSCTAGYMYYLIYVCWSWSCTAGYIYLFYICAAGYIYLLDICAAGYIYLLDICAAG